MTGEQFVANEENNDSNTSFYSCFPGNIFVFFFSFFLLLGVTILKINSLCKDFAPIMSNISMTSGVVCLIGTLSWFEERSPGSSLH